MSTRKIRKTRLYKYSTGDLRHKISFYDVAVVPEAFSADFERRYTNEKRKWAAVESVNPYHLFTEVNTETKPVTHKFIIRYDSTITSEKAIKYDGNIYKIDNIDVPELRKLYMIIYAYFEGTYDREAAQ